VLSPDEDRKFGPPGDDDESADHGAETRELLGCSEFCTSCRTIIHSLNGLRVEHTYGERRNNLYAENGIQCKDCRMRSVEGAVKVAEALASVAVIGRSEPSCEEREIHPHHFVGVNANAEEFGDSAKYAAMAEARLKSAARPEIGSRGPAAGGPQSADRWQGSPPTSS
jgi:hypothetical protein